MNEPKELSENVWFDESTNTVIVGVERLSIAFEAGEFWDFCVNIGTAQNEIKNHPDYIVGEYVEDGVVRTELMVKPDDPDFN